MAKLKIDFSLLSDNNMTKIIEVLGDVFGDEFTTATKHPHNYTLEMEYEEPIYDCRKIGDIVYLVGEKSENNEFYENCWELFNMTEEIKSGASYSIYISDIEILPKATEAEILEVKNFFNNNNR